METTLSYLGLGLDINTPTLGILLRNARSYFLNYPYLLVFPAVIVSVLYHILSGWSCISDAADPKSRLRGTMEKNQYYPPKTLKLRLAFAETN